MFSFNNDYKVLQFFPMVVLICYFYISMTISLMLLKLKPKNALLPLFLNNKTGIITGHIVMTSLQYYQGNFYPFLICKRWLKKEVLGWSNSQHAVWVVKMQSEYGSLQGTAWFDTKRCKEDSVAWTALKIFRLNE